MPSHWTYEQDRPEGDLFQGDIIERAEPLLAVLGSYHKYFCDEKYLCFIVVSQTCDLVVRGGECKTKYINLAAIRSLEALMPTFLEDACGTKIPGVYFENGRADIKELIARIINQNEQALGLFYLEPDGDLKLAVPSVALLRVSIALRSREHYGIIAAARVGRLQAPFRNKLGWLAGNLYSRVDTPDWPEKIGRNNADKKVDSIFKDIDRAANNVWVSRPLFDLAVTKNADLLELPKEKIRSAIQEYAPKPPHQAALARVTELAAPLLESITPVELDAVAEQFKENRAYPRLIADAIASALQGSVEPVAILDLAFRVGDDIRIREAAAAWLKRLGAEFIAAKGRKDYPVFLSMFSDRPILDAGLLAAVGEMAAEAGMPDERLAAAIPTLQALKATSAMCDCVQTQLQAAASKNLAVRLAKRLDNDAAFRGAFTA